jgi:hypothetical protein
MTGYSIQILGNEEVNPVDYEHLQEDTYTLTEALTLATDEGLDLRLFDEQGTLKGFVQSDGDWRLL